MAAITVPYLPNTGDPLEADPLMRDFFDPDADSYGVIDGDISSGNFTDFGTPFITHKDIRPRTHHKVFVTGRTSDLDYFKEIFAVPSDESLEGPTHDLDYKNKPFAGGGLRFYLPWEGKMTRISWMTHWANDARRDTSSDPVTYDESSQIKLFIDGSPVDCTKRGVRLSVQDGPLWPRDPRRGDRAYHGHYLKLNLASGWHNAELRVISNARQTRIRVTNFSVLAFR